MKSFMNCEFNRLDTFKKTWPHSSAGSFLQFKLSFTNDSVNFYAKPSVMAQSGFYHEPKLPTPQDANITLAGIDNCICFSCQLALDSWEPIDDPWFLFSFFLYYNSHFVQREAHLIHSPSCRFVQVTVFAVAFVVTCC